MTLGLASPSIRNQGVINMKTNPSFMWPNISKQVKLKPLKNLSTIIDPDKNRRKLQNLQEKGDERETRPFADDVVRESEESKQDVLEQLKGSLSSSKQSKRNRRYSNSIQPTDSVADQNFKLMDDTIEISLYDQLNRSIIGGNNEDDSRMYVEGSNGRKISIVGIKSPERTSKKGAGKNSEDRAMYQASTV